MPVQLPDPLEVARGQAAWINANRDMMLEGAVQRTLEDCPFIDPESLLGGLESFHRERMRRVPSPTKYPESPIWVEHLLAVDRELKRLANLSDREMAILRSLGAYLTFRGYGAARPAMVEKCRIAYLPESEVGQIHIKNVDDPATHWKCLKPPPSRLPAADSLVQDGVGSGLHIDDEPEEIFPLDARTMLGHYAQDVHGGVEFLKRYKPFWGGCNIVLHDKQKRSVAIEKCSVSFIEVFHPGADGVSHCSGMVCRDSNSPQGKHQRQKRGQYLEKYGQGADGWDQAFWDACDRAERMLADGLRNLGQPARVDDVVRIFRTPWPEGLSKEGAKLHPRQTVAEYTLVTHMSLPDQRRYVRWQRDPQTLKMPAEPETYQF